ncbi:hypothetical protein B4U45_04370 [Mycobacterium persicum]|uniref:Uncharacterized protein n=1 Tax=Mycobacterium persicum TaxID=1487726 RepID=A0A8E2IMZ6_9MYCO|nr:hypothetical protein A4G31_03655 [Mycobacterium persicum]ORB46623.1 hypothetical protein BST40_18100 [Mycobacterium persicum]ORB88575.1 hypothetical protein B1T49_04020 [Mycobacterium persicum]ORB93886.1 hypothetical protein B1T44_04345 [Mycobacterium persicum]ORC00620.1 hypothetical protein B1T48_03955 [Mycobacterium persicum]
MGADAFWRSKCDVAGRLVDHIIIIGIIACGPSYLDFQSLTTATNSIAGEPITIADRRFSLAALPHA